MHRSTFAFARPAVLIVATTALAATVAPATALARTRAARIVERRLSRILGPEAAARAVRAQAEQAVKEAAPPPKAPAPTAPRPPAPQPRPATTARAATPAPPRRLAAPGPLARLQAAKPTPTKPAALDAEAAAALFAGRTPPFTAAWYAEHPQAWRHEKPDAEWWRPLDPDALVAWLDKPRFAAGTESATPGVWTIDEPAGAAPAADGTRSVLVAAEEPADTAAWQPLGVFAVAPAGVARPLALQQLAVDRDGSLRGNHLDAVSGVVQPISGTLDVAGRSAAWTVGAAGARFKARLDDLAAPTATVAVQTAGGAESWALARLADPGAGTPTPADAPAKLLPTP